MLVCFSASNFRSIDDMVSLDLRANSRLRRLKDHVRKPEINNTKKNLPLLKSAVIYGANASGKSNIIKALEYAKNYATEGPQDSGIDRNPFKFNPPEKPSNFYFEFITSGIRIGYMFQIDDHRVLYEKLFEIDDDYETCIFERIYVQEDDEYTISSGINFSGDENAKRIWNEFTTLFDYCPENKLALTEINQKNIKVLRQKLEHFSFPFLITDQFLRYQLITIFPSTKYGALGRDIGNEKYKKEYNDTLRRFDTGVNDLTVSPVSKSLFDKEHIERIEKNLTARERDFMTFEHNGAEYYVSKNNDTGYLEFFSIVTVHRDHNGNEKEFNIIEESDGTIRLLDLIPVIEDDERNEGTVFLIDEFDRSLHPNLSKSYFQLFMEKTKNNCDQLIVTTHQSELLDNQILRRDEIWFAQKEKDQSTQLYTLDEFNTRPDMDIRYAYLKGKFGAIPFIK